jgi:hypothetical protein
MFRIWVDPAWCGEFVCLIGNHWPGWIRGFRWRKSRRYSALIFWSTGSSFGLRRALHLKWDNGFKSAYGRDAVKYLNAMS